MNLLCFIPENRIFIEVKKMIQTVRVTWDEFKERYAFLLDELLPALRGIDDVSLAVRSAMWSIIPHWEKGEFIFEYYGEEPLYYAQSDEKVQLLIINVPWEELHRP